MKQSVSTILITSLVSLISTGLYASNRVDGMAVIVMAFVASIC